MRNKVVKPNIADVRELYFRSCIKNIIALDKIFICERKRKNETNNN